MKTGLIHFGLLFSLGLFPMLASAQEDRLSSARDHSSNANRDLLIKCRDGDLERVPGKTMNEVFGDAWPAQPEPATPESHGKARMISMPVNPAMVRGIPTQPALVVAAVLVGVDGKAMDVVPVCATAAGFDSATKRLYAKAKYLPATINGQPVVSVAMTVIKYKNGEILRQGDELGRDALPVLPAR